MKVNPLGIQSYQHLNRQDRSQAQPADAKKPGSETVRGGERKVMIEPQNRLTTSAISVKAPDRSYAENLSQEERQALELLFSRFRDASRFVSDTGDKSGEAGIGQVVDIKV